MRIKKEIRGALGIIAFTEEQRNSGLFNRDAFIHFTEKLSELISGKIEAAEYADDLMVNLNETLAILNSVHDGVIAVDTEARIYRINQSAVRKFGVKESLIGQRIDAILPDDAAGDIMM